MQKIARLATRVLAGVYAVSAFVIAAYAQATPQQAEFYPSVRPENLPTTINFGELLTKVINYFLGLVGLIAVLMLVIGGLRYITSAGNDQSLEKAKNTILYAIIGIVIVVLSYAIVVTITSTLKSL